MGSATLIPIMAASTTTILIAMALLSSHSSPLITSVHADAASTAEASHEPASITSFAQFPYDENNHLASHIFAFPGTDPCRSLFEEARKAVNLHSHIAMAVDGEVAAALFGDKLPTSSSDVSDITGCPAVCLDRGIDAELVPYPMPEKYYNINADHGEHDASLSSFLGSHSCGKVEIGIINYYPKPVNLYWVNFSGGEQLLYSIERMEKNTRFIHTYIDHRFRARDPDTNQTVFDETVQYAATFGIGNHINPHRDRDIRDKVKSTMNGEWRKKQMVKRTFSKLGFDKGRLPLDLYGSMRSYYYNNREFPHRLMEEWDSKGVYVNYWETDCNFIQIPWTQKKWWQMRLLDVVQEWAGVEIEQTDLYGMRQYTRGARLLTHVDRINTHAVSLIVNIAQGNVTQPWTVEVYDHADRLHEVAMEPGDIVYYESAKALHGRNTPLAGGYYTNLFTHYRPTGDPLWYEKDNPPGTPEPLLDVGRCELVGGKDEYSVGAVKCENDAIGPHLSPKLFTAGSGEDLYDLWLSVGPSFDEDQQAEEPHEKDEEEEEEGEYYEEDYDEEDESNDYEGEHDEF